MRVDLRAHTLRTAAAVVLLLAGRCTLVARVEPTPDAPTVTLQPDGGHAHGAPVAGDPDTADMVDGVRLAGRRSR